MKQALVRISVLVLVTLGFAGVASAQIPVTDVANAGLNQAQLLKAIQDAIKQAQQVRMAQQQLQMRVDELRHMNMSRAFAHYAGSWNVQNLFSCSPWARIYQRQLNQGTNEIDAYLRSVVPALANCNSRLPPLYDAVDRQRKKLDNASVEALAALGTSRTDLRRQDETFGFIVSSSTANSEVDRTEKALLQKITASSASALPALRNLQRQNDALLQLLLAQAAAQRDEQAQIVNAELRRQEIWDSYRAHLVGN